MASGCEVLVDPVPEPLARRLLEIAAREAWRIERKYSRYRPDSEVARIHRSRGAPVEVDDETAGLLDFAAACHAMSGGRFDVTSGVLRRAWRFDGSDRVPAASEVEALLPSIGWEKLAWRRPILFLPEGMEIDFGGIGKEYAVDRAFEEMRVETGAAFLVNFGGDLRASGPRCGERPWVVGIEDPGAEECAVQRIELSGGALATSGDSRRFLEKDGVRYSHVLDPRTGWPVRDAPRSVTVAAPTCLEAGMLATMALLHGPAARAFLQEQGAHSWCVMA
ncbi:MAG: FAD:protein FMN transferase [Candidatus Eisenbacteria bacterium]|nr:FAD:protein FMN transferase [Candidatus Eisenbacteria bacterium]